MLLELRNLDKDYSLGKTTIAALRGVNLCIDHGEFVSIMGPSGCGKTTLLNILGCIDRPTRGQVLFGGTDVAGLSDNQETDKRLGEIGFIFQS
ncbi:MAG: ATP-binding cassette domain-containing protein, partial [Spirochaetota bacterium]